MTVTKTSSKSLQIVANTLPSKINALKLQHTNI